MFGRISSTLIGYYRYRGRGHLTFLIHRIAGLATFIFLSLHIVTTSAVFLAPQLYEALIQIFRNPLIIAIEIILAFFVVFHGVNGFRIAFNDIFKHQLWGKSSTRKALLYVFIVSLILWIPAMIIMSYHLFESFLGN